MKTAQMIKREFYGGIIRQNHKTSYFCVNDLTKIANQYRVNRGLPKAKWVKYSGAVKTKEFFNTLMKTKEIANIITKTKGRTPQIWVHPLVLFDYAMWLSPHFKIHVYDWLYDNLIVFRDESGESYKKMCSVLAKTQNYTPAQCGLVIPELARAIKRDLQVDDWNKTTPEKLKLRDEVHKSMILSLKMGVKPEKAYSIIREDFY